MKIKLNLWVKFSILVLFFALILGWLLGSVLSSHLREAMLNRARGINADYVQAQANLHFTPEHFSTQDYARFYGKYKETADQFKTREVVNIKIWNARSEVIYSDNAETIGKTFLDNHELKEALEGKIEAEISQAVKSEHLGPEKKAGEIMELYVPIAFAGGKTVAGVIEVYYNLDFLNDELLHVVQAMWRTLSAFILAGIFSMLLLFGLIISRPLGKLNRAIKELGEGNFEARAEVRSRDELGELSIGFNQMAEDLKKINEAEKKASADAERIRALKDGTVELEKKVAERTLELSRAKEGLEQKVEERTKELRGKLEEREKMYKAVVGRELRMEELEKENEALRKQIQGKG